MITALINLKISLSDLINICDATKRQEDRLLWQRTINTTVPPLRREAALSYDLLLPPDLEAGGSTRAKR